MSSVQIGHPVEDFECPSTGDKVFRLSELRGRKVIIYFYPKDNTPGCTQEGLDFKANIDEFDRYAATVVGVSRDSVKVHEGFKCKQDFPFDLLSDQDEQLCRQFDVIKQKNMYGKT